MASPIIFTNWGKQGVTDNEYLVEEREPEDIKHDDEVLMCAPPSDEAIPNPFPPAQEEEDEVSHFPFQVFSDTLLYNSEREEEIEPLDKAMMHALPFDEVV